MPHSLQKQKENKTDKQTKSPLPFSQIEQERIRRKDNEKQGLNEQKEASELSLDPAQARISEQQSILCLIGC